jgi:hypothetical protein
MDLDYISESDSASSEDPVQITESADALLPLMNSVISDMEVIETKVHSLQEDIYTQKVRPAPGLMRTVWTALDLPAEIEFDALLKRIFNSAERLDTATRTIHFTDDFAPIFGKSYMSLYELVDILIDSLEFFPA